MKILQVCSKVPFYNNDGGSKAMSMLTDGLVKNGNKLTVFAVNPKKNFFDKVSSSTTLPENVDAQLIYVNTNVNVFSAFLNILSNKSYNITRFVSKSFKQSLIEILKKENFDIIQLESLFVTPYIETIRKHSNAKIVYRAHNIEFKIWENLAKNELKSLKKLYLKFLAKRLKKFEIGILNEFNAILPITKKDESYFVKLGCTIPQSTVPFGLNFDDYQIKKNKNSSPTLFHLGAMDWLPNIQAIEWFLKNVWQKLLEKHSEITLQIAGRNMPEWLLNIKVKNVFVKGEVENAIDFMNSNNILIVPLLAGSGMRVKIIEGMALAKTIVSTSIGAEGINYENEKNILIANTPDEFVSQISKCISNKLFCETIGNNARILAETEYDNVNICKRLTDFYQTL